MNKFEKNRAEIQEFLGMSGRMLSGSKTLYRKSNPSHLVFFNANVFFVETAVKKFLGFIPYGTEILTEKVWYGDIDLTVHRNALRDLARATGETVYVIPESWGRFEFTSNPDLSRFVYQVSPDGDERLGTFYEENEEIIFNEEVVERMVEYAETPAPVVEKTAKPKRTPKPKTAKEEKPAAKKPAKPAAPKKPTVRKRKSTENSETISSESI